MDRRDTASRAKALPPPVGELTTGEMPHLIHEYMEFLAMAAELEAQAPLFTFTVAGELWVFLTGSELISTVSRRGSDGLALGPSAEGYLPVIGHGLPANFTATWRRQRLIVSRALSPRSVRLYCDAIARMTADRVQRWIDIGEIDVHQEMLGLAFDGVGEALFSGDLAEARARFLALDEILLEDWEAAYGNPSHETGSLTGLEAAVAGLDAFLYDLIARRRSRPEDDQPDVLSRLLTEVDEEGKPLSDGEVRDEAVNLILAGHETTANALTFAISLLGRHPEWLAALRREIALTIRERRVAAGDLELIPTVRWIVDETLRLYPVSDLHDRRASEDIELGGYLIPAGTPILFTSWMKHHDARFFAEPESFEPDRFAPERREAIPRQAYSPFGAGPRTCPGNHFALMEAVVALITIAQEADLTLVDLAPPVLQRSANLAPKTPIRARVTKFAS